MATTDPSNEARTHHHQAPNPGPYPHPIPPLWGRSLRFVLLGHLMAVGQATVAEMVALLANRGYEVDGRASKVISDSLRWEVRRRRVIRVARGVYRYRSAPATTARRVRLFAERCHRWLTAAADGQPPPQTPPDPRASGGVDLGRPEYPPWLFMGWLWVA